MKAKFFCIVLFLSVLLIHSEMVIAQAPHGGQLKPSGKFQIEAVNALDKITVYLLDSTLQTINNQSIRGRVVFNYADSTFINADLSLVGGNGLSAPIAVPGYFYCSVFLDYRGFNLTANFEGQELIVEKKKLVGK